MEKYYIVNKNSMKPINVINGGDEIQYKKNVCETYSTYEQAEKRLNHLREAKQRRGSTKNLIISTYAEGFS